MTETVRAALYARISEDATGEQAGVDRQLRDTEALSRLRGWTIAGTFHDNDISALRGKIRPGYTALLAAVARGEVDRIIVWQTSRLWRNRAERARDIDTFAAARVGIIACKGPDLDLSTAYGRAMAGLLGEFDTMESEVKGERVAAAAADRARKGKPNGGLGYGWARGEAGSWVVDDDQAAVVREITERLLAGESLRGVTADLNGRAVPPPGADLKMKRRADTNPDGRRWGRSSVRKLANRPANAGLRVHRKGRPDEVLLEGQWPAIIERDRWERVTAMFSAQGSASVRRPGARRHLLSYSRIGACGVCGGPLCVGTKAGHVLYLCEPGACVGRNQEKVDELVSAVAVERLSRPDAREWLAGDDKSARAAGDRAEALRARLDAAADRYALGKLGLAQLERITAKVRPEIEAAERERLAHLSMLDPAMLATLAGPKAAQGWAALKVAQRHNLLEAMGVRVVIDRTRKGPGFNRESVRVEWRQP